MRPKQYFNKKYTDVICYLTAVGWLLVYFWGEKENSKLHMNQALVLILLDFITSNLAKKTGMVGTVGICLNTFVVILAIIGMSYALRGEDKELPLIGRIKILK